MALRTAHRPVEKSLLYGWLISFLLLSFNNVWEFGQEPYWFWIGGSLLGQIITSITSPLAFTAIRKPANSGVRETKYTVTRASPIFCNERPLRKFFTEGEKILWCPAALSAPEQLTQDRQQGSFTLGLCINPRLFKPKTGNPSVIYNPKLALPAKKAEIDLVSGSNATGVIGSQTYRNSKIRHLITDSTCPTQWNTEKQLRPLRSLRPPPKAIRRLAN